LGGIILGLFYYKVCFFSKGKLKNSRRLLVIIINVDYKLKNGKLGARNLFWKYKDKSGNLVKLAKVR